MPNSFRIFHAFVILYHFYCLQPWRSLFWALFMIKRHLKVMGWWCIGFAHTMGEPLLPTFLFPFITRREGFSPCLPTSLRGGTGLRGNHTQTRIGMIKFYQRSRHIFISCVVRSYLPSPKFWLSKIFSMLGWVRVSPWVSLSYVSYFLC